MSKATLPVLLMKYRRIFPCTSILNAGDEDEYVAAGWLPLTSISPGEKITIRRIHETAEDNHELLEFLEVNGIVPGTPAEVTEVLSFNQTLNLQLGEKKVTLGFPTAKYIFVEKAA